jgi:hypothetical protein
MLNGDCRRKFDFSSKPVCAHWAPLWPNVLYMYDWKRITGRRVILSDRHLTVLADLGVAHLEPHLHLPEPLTALGAAFALYPVVLCNSCISATEHIGRACVAS